MKSALSFILLPIFFLMLFGCKSPQVTLETIGSMDNSNWQGNQPYEVMVVAYAYESGNRIAFEDQMTKSLRRAGIDAHASHLNHPAMNSINTQTLNAYLQEADNRAIFFAHALSITRQDHSDQRTDPNESIFGSDHTNWEIQVGAIIEAALYVKEIKAAVWLNRTRFQSETAEASNGMQLYVKELISEMRNADIISRLK